jgi:hypothetical protein
MIFDRLGSRVSRELALFVAGAFLILGSGLVVVSFATAEERFTRFGTALLPDFTAMYVAGTVLNEHGPARLYDFALQDELRHELVPALAADDRLPYLYAPWFACVWRGLAAWPYERAALAWVLVSVGLMLGGFFCLRRVCPEFSRRDWLLVVLLGVSFEPHLFECLANGQVSAIPFCSLCAALWLVKSGRPWRAGLVLSLLTYKPTQPILLMALLLVGRRWRIVAGIVCGVLLLAGLTALLLGPGMLWEYPVKLLEYGRETSVSAVSSGLELRWWKYVDLQSFARLAGSFWRAPLLVVATAVGLTLVAVLGRRWHTSRGDWTVADQQAWAGTLILLPVLNVYFAIYDAILMLPGAVLAVSLAKRDRGDGLPPPLAGHLAAVYVAGMLAPASQVLRVNLLTLSLLLFGWHVLCWPRAEVEPEASPETTEIHP